MLQDRLLKTVAEGKGTKSTIAVREPNLWWPHLMHEDPGYLYTLKVSLSKGSEIDVYRLKFGIRSVAFNNTDGVLINHRKFYFTGFGRHEDSDFRGKGLDLPLVAKDFNLIKWTNANSFRTSHYPYAEEIMDFADENGIAIIDETPGKITLNDMIPHTQNYMCKKLFCQVTTNRLQVSPSGGSATANCWPTI